MRADGCQARRAAMQVVVALVAGILAAVTAGAQDAGSSAVGDLPLVEMPASKGHILAVFLTGDGGWASLDREVAATLAAHGVAVVGLKSCEYLSHERSPEDIADAVARVMRRYTALWNRDRVVLMGYSRGADLAPFVVNRLPEALRRQIALVAMLGLGDRAGFECHLVDLVRDVRRSSDRPTIPELDRITDLRLFCVYGSDERASPCRRGAVPAMARVGRAGAHHFDGDYAAIARAILQRIRPA